MPNDRLMDVVIDRTLRRRLDPGAVRRVPRDRVRRLFAMLGAESARADVAEDTLAVLSLLGIDGVANDDLSYALARAQSVGVDAEHVLPIAQAYARGVMRIVEAETTAIRALLGGVSADERAGQLDRVLTRLLPLSQEGFSRLHASLLHEALSSDQAAGRLTEPSDAPMAVGLVDLSGSTQYLATASPDETRHLVDGLFTAGQLATAERPVQVLKHVGDGIFFVGRRPADVVDVCFSAIEHVQITLPLAARAGVSYGPVLRRAGDYFGLPVNLAQLLTKVARPSTVVATRSAAAELDPARLARRRRARIRGWDHPLELVLLQRPTAV
jgi:adenylate cyclase